MYIPCNGINGAKLPNATEPILGCIGNANNYTQHYIMNRFNGVNASADLICYPNNGTDAAGWIDMGITSQTFAQAAYGVTTFNEGYLFMSAPSGTFTGSLMIGTDSSGSANAVSIFTNGFTTKANICFTWDKFGNSIAIKGQADQSYSYQVPTTGNTYTVPAGVRTVVYDPAGALAAHTTQMPAAPIDGQLVEISYSQAITTLTITPNTGQSLGNGMPVAALAGQGFGFIYRLALTKWFRTY